MAIYLSKNMKSKQLACLRKKIDRTDYALVKVIAKRFIITGRIMALKVKNNLPIEDRSREGQIIEKIEKLAEKFNLEFNLLRDIFSLIIKETKDKVTRFDK